MKKRGKGKYYLAIIVLVFLYGIGLWKSNLRLTYLEYTTINDSADSNIILDTINNELRQEFCMPYDIFDSVSIQIGTFGRDNNSTWEFSLLDSSGAVLYKDSFNASGIEDNGYYRHKIDKRLSVRRGETYSFCIRAQDVSSMSQLVFWTSATNTAENTILSHNGTVVDNTLCFRVYGGDRDYWWHGLATLFFLYSLAIIWRFYANEKSNRSLRDDIILQGMVLGAVCFLLLCSFATYGLFTDENDNMRGGMVIASGGVLYRDYVTQHTPVVYYLCAVFAALGAGSVEQFRLSYYVFESVVWMVLYIRHREYFGERKMALLPLLEVIFITSVTTQDNVSYGCQILSDGFQGLMFTALLLEFLRYYRDRNLNWDRSVIISICIWGSFGAAFVSAYALFFLAILFVVLEVLYLTENKYHINELISRYYRLFVSMIVPLIAAIIYFKANHALGMAFEQFYTFNREVYPKYTGGLGGKIIQPFINAVQNFFSLIADSFIAVISATATNVTILQLVLMTMAVGIVIKIFERKEYIAGLALTLMTVFSATRGYGFHGLAAWYLVILIIVLYLDLYAGVLRKIGLPVLGIICILLSSTFFVAVGNNLLYEQGSITELESKVVDMTEHDENKDVFLDAYCCDSLYLFYKGRKPINPAVYMLPWYMDWYEDENVSSLLERRPHVVVYDEDRETWGITHYTNSFDTELQTHYTRLGDDGWKHSIWVKNE